MYTPIIRRLIACQHGATAIEYALIAALLSVAIIGALISLGGSVNNQWEHVRTEVEAVDS